MIKIFSEDRSRSFGWFKNFKVAKDALDRLLKSGELGETPSLLVGSYKNNTLQQEYTVTYSAYFGRWGIAAVPQACTAAVSNRKKVQRKKSPCKVYKSAVACFKEGFPDWMNRTYQPI
ncbi:hypothetical protein K0F38_18250 [Bacteroides fragilis]|nr:hypothetical protein [Bacteroides fragilis]MCE8655303.1 hypothetical protein [Bacteroides fragilis]MCY1134070.1 hypothetical protein [Bacteroides fragilis]